MHYSLFSVSCRWAPGFGGGGVFLCPSVGAARERLAVDLLCVWMWICVYTLGKGCVCGSEVVVVVVGGFMGKRCIGMEGGGCVRAEWGISKWACV